jgi:NadR type nicotinamide-nucleotide adenylyltransferase
VSTGLVIGKFLPPHLGHAHLVGFAAASVERLTVILFTKSGEPIPGDLRATWLRELFPSVELLHVTEEHPVDFGDPAVWELWVRAIRRVLPAGPDLVFSSEPYGDELARRLAARHVPVDPSRRAVPVSGSAIRAHPLRHWEFLPACVRPHFARRVAIVGAESTGKTTLARELAARFATAWVPEFARGYLAARGGVCEPRDLPVIAREQAAAEERLAREANRVLICDTDLVTTALWGERYFGACDPVVQSLARERRYDLTLLCENDQPGVDDGLRDSPGHREWFRERFVRELSKRQRPLHVVRGAGPGRLAAAAPAVEALLTD